MKMITKEVEKKFAKYPLYSQDGKGDDAVVICKFFNPYGGQSWYVLEASDVLDNGDRELFTYFTRGGSGEYGYVMLSDILNTRVHVWGCALPFERDRYFEGTIADAKRDAFIC